MEALAADEAERKAQVRGAGGWRLYAVDTLQRLRLADDTERVCSSSLLLGRKRGLL